ncbi:MAG: TolC family protein [Planctomycetes bacterium]|nr:TolC family protein [Planctomycetota bacterium]
MPKYGTMKFLILAGALAAIMGGCYSQEKMAREFESNRKSRAAALMNGQAEPELGLPEVITGSLSLADCIELALIHSTDVQLAKQSLLQAKGQMTEAIATALPTVNFTGSGQRNDNKGFIDQKETYDLAVLARQPLYLGGVVGAALDGATAFSYMSQQQLRQSLHMVQLQVRSLYLDALLAQELIKVSEQAKLDAEKLLSDAEKKFKFGTGTRYEVLQAEVNFTSKETELIVQQNKAQVALTTLLNMMGVSQLSEVELTDVLEFQVEEKLKDHHMRTALERRPELLVGEAMIRLAQDNIISVQAGNRPQVFLQGMYQRTYPGFSSNFNSIFSGLYPAFSQFLTDANVDFDDPGIPPSSGGGGKEWERTMYGGLQVQWAIFDGFLTDGRVTQAKAELKRQEIGLSKMEQQVQLETTQALLNLADSEKLVLAQMGNVTNAKEALRLAQVQFREGAGTSLDVISAELALARARSNYSSAVHAHQLSQLNLEWSSGTIGEEFLTDDQSDNVTVFDDTKTEEDK